MNPPLLNTIYRERYECVKIRSRRPNTKRLYRATLSFFERFLQRPATLDDLNNDTVSAFASWRLDQRLAKRTVNKDLFNLLALWRWLHTQGYVKNWPEVELETPPVRAPVALLRNELLRVMQSADQEIRPVGHIAGPVFWRALFLVIWCTGERIGAILRLEWPDVDLVNGWVRFAAENRKGAAADNLLPLTPEAIDALRELRKQSRDRSGVVFSWPHSPTYIYYRLGKIMQRAGIPDDRWHKFHVFRKSVASHYEAAGGNATDLLKHSSRRVTMTYLDPRIVRPMAPANLLFRLVGNDGAANSV